VELRVDQQTFADWSQLCRKAMSDFILSSFLQFFFGGGGGRWWWVELGKVFEIDASY